MLNSTQRPGSYREDPLQLAEPDRVTFLDISRFFRRHFAIIASCFLLAVAVAVFLIYSAQHKFTARAQILIDPNTVQVLREAGNNLERSLDTAQVEGQVAVLRSESLAYSVIGKLELTKDPEFQAPPQSFLQQVMHTVKERLGYGPDAPVQEDLGEHARLRTALDVFQNHLDVRRVGLSYAIDIAYTSVDPNKAAKIANEIANSYIQDQLKTMSRSAQQSSEWLEARLNQLRPQLNAAARQLESFKAGQALRVPDQRRDVQGRDAAAAAPTAGAADVGAQDRVATGQQRDTDARDPARQGGSTLAELESITESYRKIYESYQQAFTEAVQRQSFPVSNARIITEATRPLTKSSPRGRLILAFAGLTGLLVGTGIAFIRQSVDHTIRSARQVKAQLGISCLALVPRLDRRRRRGPVSRARHEARHGPGPGKQAGTERPGEQMPAGAGRPPASGLVADYNFRIAIDAPFSPFSGALKTLRTAIAHAEPHHPMRCVGITSAMPREGKSTIAGNLATLYAVSAGRTLIIDADIHNATASRYFAPDVAVGLLEVVTGAAPLDKAIVKGTGFVPDILPIAPKEAPVSYEQLASERMQLLLKSLRDHYDMIIVDLPPVNPIVDGVAIASLLDGVVIVAEWGRTPLELLGDVAATLHTAQANVLGAVIAKADQSVASVHWRKDWGYGYYATSGTGGRRAARAV